LCSALHNEGITEIWELIEKYENLTKSNHYFEHKRNEQNKFWLMQTIEDRLKSNFFTNKKIKEALQQQLQLIEAHQTTPFAAAEYLLSL
jgi:LAO/AO transport system kinase